MNLWAIPALLAAFGTTALCVVAYLRDSHAALNRIFAWYAGLTSVAAIASYGHLQAETFASATYWLHWGDGWPLCVAAQLHVVLALQSEQRKGARWPIVALYAVAVLVTCVMAIGWEIVPAVHAEQRWASAYTERVPRSALFESIPMAYAGTTHLLSIVLCVRCIRRTSSPRERRRALHVLIGVALPGVLAFVTEGLLPRFGIHIAAAQPLGIAIGAASIARGVVRYGLFSLDTRSASDEIVDTMEEGLLLVDRSLRITAANRAAHAMLSAREQTLVGCELASVLPIARLGQRGSLPAAQPNVRELEVDLPGADGRALSASVSTRNVLVDGDHVGTVVVVRDISESKANAERLAFAATHDALTGLPNRTMLRDRLEQAIARATRKHSDVAVVFVDLDGFKEVNDVHGHEAGDRFLRDTSALLARTLRGCDTLARIGGDEFVIVLEELDGPAGAEAAARRIAKRLREESALHGSQLCVTASMGISMLRSDGSDVATLLQTADIAMYSQKARGGDGFAFFASDMLSSLEQRARLKNELQHALERDELLLHYQPLIDARSGAINGMEALLRWRHPELGMISPADFIPIAEATGLIVPIGEWTLRRACAQAASFEREGLGELPISVNLSARQLCAPNLTAAIMGALADNGLGPERLVLEVTESTLMENEQEAARVLAELHVHGLHISIDDFGTGYSSLGRLRALPIGSLKIDRCFVRHVAEQTADAAIVRAIVAMARSLGMRLVAEGVETHAQRIALAQGDLAVDQMQGFLFSRPVEPDALAQLLRAQGPRAGELLARSPAGARPAA
jgi:diguanylate cyclase (GGDEF)-like protein/PAS domain S-box-containing protein